MSVIFVARSAELAKWAGDVGLGKNVFKIGIALDKTQMKDAIAAGWAGMTDWRLVASADGGDLTEEALTDRISTREKTIDPALYPHIRGTTDLVRVQAASVANAMLVANAMASADEPLVAPKPKAKDYGDYLIRNALR